MEKLAGTGASLVNPSLLHMNQKMYEMTHRNLIFSDGDEDQNWDEEDKGKLGRGCKNTNMSFDYYDMPLYFGTEHTSFLHTSTLKQLNV